MQIGSLFVRNTFCAYGCSWRKSSHLAVLCSPSEKQNQHMVTGSVSSGFSLLSVPFMVSNLFSACVGVWVRNCFVVPDGFD